MNNYSQYKTWQEQDGKLVPNCEKPKLKEEQISDSTYTYDVKEYDKEFFAYNESLKISLPIIGNINTIKGRKDLKIDVDWKPFECDECDGVGTCEGGKALETTCKKCNGNGIVAVLIDNKQAKEVIFTDVSNMNMDGGAGEIPLENHNWNPQQKEDVPNTDAEKQEDELWEQAFRIFLSKGDVYTYDCKSAISQLKTQFKISKL